MASSFGKESVGYKSDNEKPKADSQSPNSETELRKAYESQCETVRKLKEEVAVRDRRIAELETQLRKLESQSSAKATPLTVSTSSRTVNIKRASLGTSEV